jgi:hypothetical protein
LQNPPKFTQIGIFDLKKCHLATLGTATYIQTLLSLQTFADSEESWIDRTTFLQISAGKSVWMQKQILNVFSGKSDGGIRRFRQVFIAALE